MKRLLLLALCSGTWDSAFAKDSDWKICKGEVIMFGGNDKLVVNTYEHRTHEGRSADITFIYGGNILRGDLNTSETNNGMIKLKGDNSFFKGAAAIDYSAEALNLVGTLNLNQVTTDLSASLKCETL